MIGCGYTLRMLNFMKRRDGWYAKWVGIVVAHVMLFATLQSSAAPPTVLGLLATTMKPGTWAELETSGYTDALLQAQGFTILDYADTAVWDPSSEQVFFVGQGHYSTLKFITYSAQANAWNLMSIFLVEANPPDGSGAHRPRL